MNRAINKGQLSDNTVSILQLVATCRPDSQNVRDHFPGLEYITTCFWPNTNLYFPTTGFTTKLNASSTHDIDRSRKTVIRTCHRRRILFQAVSNFSHRFDAAAGFLPSKVSIDLGATGQEPFRRIQIPTCSVTRLQACRSCPNRTLTGPSRTIYRTVHPAFDICESASRQHDPIALSHRPVSKASLYSSRSG